MRTPSPRRRGPHTYNHTHGVPQHHAGYHYNQHHDIGFSDTVSNVVEIVKHESGRQGSRYHHYRIPGGKLFLIFIRYENERSRNFICKLISNLI